MRAALGVANPLNRRVLRRALSSSSSSPSSNAALGSATSFRKKLKARSKGVTIQFAVIPSPVATQAIAAAGCDAICIDMEHGPIDYKDVQAMVASVAGTDTCPLVRVPSIEPLAVKRSLDLGAEGIVFPLAQTAKDVERAVATLRYPPHGERGFGPFVAHSRHGFEFTKAAVYYEANPPVCCVLVETAEAVDNIYDILNVGGVDVFQLAQFDLSTALGIPGQFTHPTFLDAERRVEDAVFGSSGNAANAANAADAAKLGAVALTKERADVLHGRGYRVIVGFDVLGLKATTAASQSWVL